MRIIPGVTADTHAHVLTGHEGSKFGLAPSDAAPLIRRIESSPRLRMRGLHVHVGSQILEVALFEQRFEAGIVGRFEGPGWSYDGRPGTTCRRATSTERSGQGSSTTRAGVSLTNVSPRKYAGSFARWTSMNTMPRTIRPRPRISTSPTPPISAPLP